MAYCIYLRKSRADTKNINKNETEIDTLARHERTLLEFAQRQGYDVEQIYREVVSGETIASRPQMQRLLSEVEAGMWQGVIVMEVERLARGNSIDQGIVSQAFKLSDTLIITPSRIYNPSDEADEEYFEFGLFMSRREYKTINRRLNAGRLASCREGKYVGSVPPYGYRKEKLQNQKGYTLKPIPEQAAIVKKIYSLYLSANEKTGFGGIAQKLNKAGIKSAKAQWSASQIKKILTNEVYIGKIHWQKMPEVKKIHNGAVVKSRLYNGEYAAFNGLHEPIIDEDTFNKVQNIINGRKHKIPVNRSVKNPFAGVLVCAVCGKSLKRKPADKRRKGKREILVCPTVGCSVVGAPIDIIEKRVAEGIKIWLQKYMVDCNDGGLAVNYVSNEEYIKASKHRLEALKKQLNNIYSLLEQGLYDKDVFIERQKAVKKEMDDIINSIDEMQKEEERRKKSEIKNRISCGEKNLFDAYISLSDPKSKNDMLKEIFYKIIYTKTSCGSRYQQDKIDDFKLEFFSRLPMS